MKKNANRKHRIKERSKPEISNEGKTQTENPQVEDKKKKPDSICTGIGKEMKKLNQTLILSKTLPIIIKTDSSRDFGFRDEGESSVEECYAFSGFAV